MKKTSPAPTRASTDVESEADRLLPDGHKYVLLPDGTIARRCRPYPIAGTPYYNVRAGGVTKRIRADKLAAFLRTEPGNV